MKYYHLEEFEQLFIYFLDTFVFIKKNGYIEIPRYDLKSREHPIVLLFINEGVALLEEAVGPEVFYIKQKALFYWSIKQCENLHDIDKLTLIDRYLEFLFKDDFYAMLDTTNMWTPKVKAYSMKSIFNVIDEKQKKDLIAYI